MNATNKPAARHISGFFSADAATAMAACDAISENFRYKGVLINVAGTLRIIDSYGHVATYTVVAGQVIPIELCGAIESGSSLTAGQFIFLYD